MEAKLGMNSKKPVKTKLKCPEALNHGDSVALILPASRLEQKQFEQTQNALRRLGFFVVTYPHSKKTDLFFSASDEDRALEFEWAMSQPGVSAVFCCRGGYGSVRMLSHIDLKKAKKWTPKLVVGYSDITFLLQWIQNQLGWLGIHGPLLGQLDQSSIRFFASQMLESLPSLHQTKPKWNELKVLRAGQTSGALVGGNLSLFQLVGSGALPTKPVILAIEEVNEDYYRIDRMIWNLIDAGYGRFVKGIVLGSLKNCGKSDSKTFGLKRVHESLLRLTKGPVYFGANFGHGISKQRLLVVGANVRLNQNGVSYSQPVVKAKAVHAKKKNS